MIFAKKPSWILFALKVQYYWVGLSLMPTYLYERINSFIALVWSVLHWCLCPTCLFLQFLPSLQINSFDNFVTIQSIYNEGSKIKLPPNPINLQLYPLVKLTIQCKGILRVTKRTCIIIHSSISSKYIDVSVLYSSLNKNQVILYEYYIKCICFPSWNYYFPKLANVNCR